MRWASNSQTDEIGERMSETVTSNTEGREYEALVELSRRVKAKREAIDAYLAASVKRRDRLMYLSIFGGALAAALTAGPAIFGKPFSDWIQQDLLQARAPAWQLLCAAAMICSLVATTATQLNRSKGYDENISRARNARGALEALDVGIMCGHLTKVDATGQYLKCIEDLAFLDPSDTMPATNQANAKQQHRKPDSGTPSGP